MFSLRPLFNTYVEQIFKDAIAQKGYAKLIIALSRIVSPIAYGLWCFRKGEISKSLAILSKHNHKSIVAALCVSRSKEILNELNASFSPIRNIENVDIVPFNNKVLFACHSSGYYHPNGYAIRTSEIGKALKQKGIQLNALTRPGYPWDLLECAQLAHRESTNFGDIEFKHTLDLNKTITAPDSDYINLYSKLIQEEIRKSNCTVIHAHSSYLNGIAAAKAAQNSGILSIYEMRGLWHLSRVVKEPGYDGTEHFRYCEKMEVKAALSCNYVVTLNNSLKDWLVKKGVQENRIVVVPNGVHLISNGKKQELANSNRAYYTLGFAGSITAYEGLDDALKAIRLLIDGGKKVKLRIAGIGVYLKYLKQMVQRLNLSYEVEFIGKISKELIPEFYKSVDAVIIPRKNYAVTRLVTPLKLVEAMKFKKPVICSNLPALREVVEDELNGLLFESESPESLANVVRKIMENSDLSSSLVDAAYSKIESNFNWSNLAENYMKIYRKLEPNN